MMVSSTKSVVWLNLSVILGLGLVISTVTGVALAQNTSSTIAVGANDVPAIVHLVEPGDTLWMISERYHGRALQWPDISYDNHIPEPRRLQPGTLLLLRAAGAGAGGVGLDNTATVLAVTGDVRLMSPAANTVKAAQAVTSPASKLRSRKSAEDAAAMAPPAMVAGALVKKGESVPVGSTLKTGPDSFITLSMPNGSRATLPSNSQVKLVSFKDAKGKVSVLLDLHGGQVDARVQHSDDASGQPSYRIRTRLATIGARGTYFRVALPDSQRTLVGVLEGTVAANWGNESTLNDQSHIAKPSAALLGVGQGTVLDLARAPHQALVQNLLPAPLLQDASAPQNQGNVRVRWLPVAGAVAYRVQMARDADFIDLFAQQDVVAQGDIQNQPPGDDEGYKTWFPKLDKGSYFVRVSAIASDGLEGLFALAGFSRSSYELSGTVSMADNTAQMEFSWSPLPGSNYALELAEDQDFSKVVLIAPNLLSSTVRIAALPPGQYFWRVRANVQEHGQTTVVLSKTMPMVVGGVR